MVVEKGYAKINLVLEVVGKRDDGFHDLEMVMTSVNLYDELYFESLDKDRIIIDCEQFNHIPKEENLIYKTIVLIKEKYHISQGVSVKVIKRIPEGAGLGGGSADAAATLRALNKLWALDLTLEELAELGLVLGSDVPFCIYNKTAVVKGRGEKLYFIDDVPFGYIVMIHPNFKVSTKDIFARYNDSLKSKGNVDRLHGAVVDGDLVNISKFLYNDLEKTVDNLYKKNNVGQINFIKNELIKYGVFNAVMSGSGSTVYGICLTKKQAEFVKNKFISNNKDLFSSFKLTANSYSVTVCSIRSARKSVKTIDSVDDKTKEEATEAYNIIGPSIETKAYGRALLSLVSKGKHYKIIESPLTVYDLVNIQFLDKPIVEVYINNKLNHGLISQELNKIIERFNISKGLLININQLTNPQLKVINHQTYLARIIRKISPQYQLDVNEVFAVVDPRVRAYQFEKTYQYDSRTKKVKFLNNIPYSYLVITPLGLRRLNNYHSRKNYTDIDEQYDNLLRGLELSDYYKITSNIGNNLEDEFFSRIKKIKKRDVQENISVHVKKSRANNFTLSLDGTSIFIFCRFEKDANHLMQRLKKDSYYQTEIMTFRSEVSHKSSLQLKEKDRLAADLVSLTFDVPFDTKDEIMDLSADIIQIDDLDLERIQVDDEHLEGLFHIASPGSLFKQYDFIDITYFFYKYFHNTQFELMINDESVKILFKMECLPHIFGLHLIDLSSDEFRGRKAVQKLLSGKIRYDELKNNKNISESTFKTIIAKTQSAFLVLKDIYTNNLTNIHCYDKSIVKRPNSKLYNLKYAITRKKAVNYQRELNLVGVGFDPITSQHYFYTSFEWRVNQSIQKEDKLRIRVKKEQ